jgi:hypothetical protein
MRAKRKSTPPAAAPVSAPMPGSDVLRFLDFPMAYRDSADYRYNVRYVMIKCLHAVYEAMGFETLEDPNRGVHFDKACMTLFDSGCVKILEAVEYGRIATPSVPVWAVARARNDATFQRFMAKAMKPSRQRRAPKSH